MHRLDLDYNGKVDLFHEGEFLVPMDEFMHGAVPYRDIYLQHGLFHNVVIPWIGAKLIDPSLSGVREIRAYVQPLGVLAFYLFAILVCRNKLLPGVFMVFLCFCTIRWITPRALFGFMSLAALAAATCPPRGLKILASSDLADDIRPDLRKLLILCLRQGWPILLSGCLAILGFWHSVEIGIFSIASGLIYLLAASLCQSGIRLWRRLIPVSLFLIGAFAAFAPLGLYFLYHGAFDDLIRNVWIQCEFQNETWGLPFPNFFEVFSPMLVGPGHPQWTVWLTSRDVVCYFGPVAISLAAGFLALRAMSQGFWSSRTAPVLLLITLAGTFYFRTPLGRSDGSHYFYGFFFAFLLYVFMTDRMLAAAWDRLISSRIRIWKRLVAIPWLLAGVLSALSLIWFLNTTYGPLARSNGKITKTLNKLIAEDLDAKVKVARAGSSVFPRRQASELIRVSEYIARNVKPDEEVFDFSCQAGYLYFADRRSATRYFQVCYASLPEMQEELVRDLERKRVRLVIFKTGSGYDSIDGVPANERHPIIAEYLKKKYKPAARIGEVVFWMRKMPEGE